MNHLGNLLVKSTFRRAVIMALLFGVLLLIPFRAAAQENYDTDPELPGGQQASHR